LAQTLQPSICEDGVKNGYQRTMREYSWMKVVDVMTKDPLTMSSMETIGQADDLMNTNRIRQIPVADGKRLVGIVTDRDIRSFLSGSLLESAEAREQR
jgi:CBS domain-containing protein